MFEAKPEVTNRGRTMDAITRLFKLVIGALIIVPIVWAASCSMLGVGAVYAVKKAAKPVAYAVHDAENRDRERRRRDRLNYEAGYGPRQPGDPDY